MSNNSCMLCSYIHISRTVICILSPCFCRGCQNGSVYVWTLPQGGTVVSLPNILNNSPSQDKNNDVKVSSALLLGGPAADLAPLISWCWNAVRISCTSYSRYGVSCLSSQNHRLSILFTAGQRKVCVCASGPHHGSEVPFILLQWNDSGVWRDRGAAQHLVLTGQETAFTAPATF